MKLQEKENQDGLYYILAVIFGVLTGWVVTESILWAFAGSIFGLLTAAFYVNVVVNGSKNRNL
ncbi:hypothetical protein [Pedobacter sp. SYSU D00535]|uniref:hypothetical protein n=1 Tax=Pedobacter sp. SYSU D00535 TaxID=2810308 RepID=UPI001A967CD0|nr:hypothetical protein [Pedobacter sp. SYSU D00535]